MKESDHSSVWAKYREAKQNALGTDETPEPELTLEELEIAIREAAAASGIPETGLPPRAIVHPIKRAQLSRWFYLVLVLLFAGLVTGLVWWGYKQYD